MAFQNASMADQEYAAAYSNMGRIYEDQGAVAVRLRMNLVGIAATQNNNKTRHNKPPMHHLTLS